MRIILIISVLLSLPAIAGCGGRDERDEAARATLDDWYDKPERTLVRRLGAPDSVYLMTDGGRILTWRRSRTESQGGESYTASETRIIDGKKVVVPVTRQKPITTVRYECVMSFELDSAGYVVGYTADGNDCEVPPPAD